VCCHISDRGQERAQERGREKEGGGILGVYIGSHWFVV